jgi:hypothetical protein
MTDHDVPSQFILKLAVLHTLLRIIHLEQYLFIIMCYKRKRNLFFLLLMGLNLLSLSGS